MKVRVRVRVRVRVGVGVRVLTTCLLTHLLYLLACLVAYLLAYVLCACLPTYLLSTYLILLAPKLRNRPSDGGGSDEGDGGEAWREGLDELSGGQNTLLNVRHVVHST